MVIKCGNFTKISILILFTTFLVSSHVFAAKRDAEEAFRQGVRYYNLGYDDDAISTFTLAIEFDPGYEMAYYFRGLVYGHKGRDDQAISDYSKAIELNPKNGLAYTSRGLAYGIKGNYSKAILDFTRVIELDPTFAQSYIYRGDAYYATRNYDKAWEDIHKAEQLGAEVDPRILEGLKKASGREK
ncbi:MAG: tetratricopeptide repeat protein [Candidatus Omnitrophica bacterium]|nr:tetratricopeptide repeat protein [Candidatus Omnitrophota bacterium]